MIKNNGDDLISATKIEIELQVSVAIENYRSASNLHIQQEKDKIH